MSNASDNRSARFFLMLTLVFAGEIVFGLPFHTARFFRPTFLEAFNFSNTQLGDVFAVYGIMAMIAYFPGGILADRFSARSLLTVSLVATGLGGLYMATYPGVLGMSLLYGYWGVTTILLFWGALIRATREWGGDNAQGVAFGVLEGGRGLVAAALSTMGVVALAVIMPDAVEAATNAERREAFRAVILLYAIAALLAGAMTWFVIPPSRHGGDSSRGVLAVVGIVASRPLVWAQALIIICAYCGYKGLDNYSLYAVQVLGMDEVDGAKLSMFGGYIRPFAPVILGLLADRWAAARSTGLCFGVLVISFALLSMALPEGVGLVIIYGNLVISIFTLFALRGIYFALLEENRVPPFLTGAVAGMVSFIGFTPDFFFGPITGRILDASPGLAGHQNYFLFLTGASIVGLLAVMWLLRLQRATTAATWPTAASLRLPPETS
ncbi:MAG TPA: MFS transporter [Woeseiaceae bacterium]